jgi:hypothetical protein
MYDFIGDMYTHVRINIIIIIILAAVAEVVAYYRDWMTRIKTFTQTAVFSALTMWHVRASVENRVIVMLE